MNLNFDTIEEIHEKIENYLKSGASLRVCLPDQLEMFERITEIWIYISGLSLDCKIFATWNRKSWYIQWSEKI